MLHFCSILGYRLSVIGRDGKECRLYKRPKQSNFLHDQVDQVDQLKTGNLVKLVKLVMQKNKVKR